MHGQLFESVQRSGVDFVLRNAATPQKHQIETMPGGIAIFDFDNDGRPDIFFANGALQPSLVKSAPQWSNQLYRNLGNWKFANVTTAAGLSGTGYSMGAAAGDFDNDGFTDLLVTGVRTLALYRNRGDGAFTDVTTLAGLRATEWSVSAGWFDFDNDGDLDLFIVNYCKWNPATEPFCGDRKRGYRTYCHPKFYEPLANTLYRNNGNGTFTDVSESSGIAGHLGKGMGLAFADYDDDGRMDVFVANDTTRNFLFRNEGSGRFREVGLAAGVAMTDDGLTLSSMGVEWRDFDRDGKPDVFITALANETFPLFRNLGGGLFQEVTYRSGLGAATLQYSGWSTGAYDFDRDGWRDVLVANGDVQDNTEIYSSRASKQRNLVFQARGNGTFAALPFGEPAQYRGAAFGDLDGDGRVDAVITRLNGPAVLLKNVSAPSNHWLGVRLRGRKSNHDGIGAAVRLTAAGRTQLDHMTTTGGYLCSSEKALWFGLGATAAVERIEVAWPSGVRQTIEKPGIDRYLLIEEP